MKHLIFTLFMFWSVNASANIEVKRIIDDFKEAYGTNLNILPSHEDALFPIDTDSLEQTIMPDVSLDSVSVSFVNDLKDGETIGECNNSVKNVRKILISTPYWSTSSSIQHKALIYHELGHCYLNRSHRLDLYFSDNCPKSLMYPSLPSDLCIISHDQEYLFELNHHL